MSHWRTLALTSLLGPSLRAQDINRVVSGVVFDSVAHAPLAGAVIQVAAADAGSRIFTTTADTAGATALPVCRRTLRHRVPA
jgi:hypothetical protein